MKRLIPLVVGALVSGCIDFVPAIDTSGIITATPKAFPYPGMYSGSSQSGIVTFKIRADGRGVSCFRNKFSGKLLLGDVKYDGAYLHTEDGVLIVESVTENNIMTRVKHATDVTIAFHRIRETPSICRDFFSQQ